VKVLFVNPSVEMVGIQCLSAFLKENGHTTALVNDGRLFDNPWVKFPALAKLADNRDELLEEIKWHKPDLIAFSVVTDDYLWALGWSELLKNELKDTPIVFGNIHPTTLPYEVLKQDSVDLIVRGEGELTLLELVDNLDKPENFEGILGLGYKVAGNIKVNSMRPLIQDLDIIPYPDKDLYYNLMPHLNHGYTTMSGRGCPYHCSFCDNTTSINVYAQDGIKTKWARRHSPQRVVDEILWAKEKYGIKHVRFNDEDFSYSKSWIKKFAKVYKEQVGIPYFAWVYPNTIDEEIAKVLKRSGCLDVEMGIQSGSEHIRLDVLKRNTTNAQIIKAMKALRKEKIRATVDVIVGLPTETEQDLINTILLLLECRPWHIYAFWLRYYPSTNILKLVADRGLISKEEIDYIKSNFHTRGHLAGGTELERKPWSKKYHTLILLVPVLPQSVIKYILKYRLVKWVPHISPFILVNVTKMLKPNHYDEFRIRGYLTIYKELGRMMRAFLKRLISGSKSHIKIS
jgi:anaerobic magnesium-protoporphyrin IX monomethyl ester cyclase